MYLSQLRLNPRHRQVQAELRNPYELHRTLAKAFGQGVAYTAARPLFRVDVLPSGNLPVLLLQSLREPCWQHLTVPATYLLEPPVVKPLDPVFQTGQRLRFRLQANPTVKREGKRHLLRTEEEQIAWLRRKGDDHGFALIAVRLREAAACTARTTEGRAAHLEGVIFDGVLRVGDPAAFRAALETGIGAGKGFGFGLLSLARG